jgi:hypothetical protein
MSILARFAGAFAALACLPAIGAAAAVGSHLWVVNEIFSSPDGTVQFIELKECCGSPMEHAIGGKDVYSNTSNYTFPANINPLASTANRHILLATAAFAALPGAPTPDHIIQESFFSLDADVIRWHIYPAATLTFGPGYLPLDGVTSLNQDLSTGPNSPTNFFNQSGHVQVAVGPPAPVPAVPGWGLGVFASLVMVAGAWVLVSRPRSS